MAAVMIVFTLVLLVSFYTVYQPQQSGDTGVTAQENAIEGERGQNVSLEDLTTDPNAFVGRVISVRGQVDQNIGTRGLTVNTSGNDQDALLIVSKKSLVGVGGGPGEGLYQSDEGVRVSGVVRTFNLNELEEEIGAPLNEEAYRMYEGKPVIIAESIVPLQDF